LVYLLIHQEPGTEIFNFWKNYDTDKIKSSNQTCGYYKQYKTCSKTNKQYTHGYGVIVQCVYTVKDTNFRFAMFFFVFLWRFYPWKSLDQ
jgi:hypothetical protein